MRFILLILLFLSLASDAQQSSLSESETILQIIPPVVMVSATSAAQQNELSIPGIPLIPPEPFAAPGNRSMCVREEIRRIPTRQIVLPLNVNDWISTIPGVYQKRRGDDVHIYGSR